MAQPEMNGSQFEHGEEVGGMLFVAGGEPTRVFDAVARAVEHRAEAGFPATMDHRRDVGCGTGGFDLTAQPIGVVGLVGQHDGVLAQMTQQPGGSWAVACLAGVRTSSSGRPRASVRAWILVVSPPRERPIQRSGWLFLSWRNADHAHRGAVDHLHIAVVGLADGGRDAVPGAPVRSTQKIPFRTRRSPTRGTPRGLFGSNGAITPHSKSLSSYPCMIKLPQLGSLMGWTAPDPTASRCAKVVLSIGPPTGKEPSPCRLALSPGHREERLSFSVKFVVFNDKYLSLRRPA